MKWLSITILFCLLSQPTFSQSKVEYTISDTLLAANLVKEARFEFKQMNFGKAYTKNVKALNIYQQTVGKQSLSYTKSLLWTGQVLWQMGDFDQSINLLEEALTIRSELFGANSLEVAEAMDFIGDYYFNCGSVEKALGFYKKSRKRRIGLIKNGHILKGRSLAKIGTAYLFLGNLPEASFYYEKALELNLPETTETKLFLGGVKSDLGVVYKNKREYRLSEEYYLAAEKLYEGCNDKKFTTNLYINLMHLYGLIPYKYPERKEECQRLELEYVQKLESELLILSSNGMSLPYAHILDCLSAYYGDYDIKDKFMSYTNQVLKIFDELDIKQHRTLGAAYMKLAEYHANNTSFKNTLNYFRASLKAFGFKDKNYEEVKKPFNISYILWKISHYAQKEFNKTKDIKYLRLNNSILKQAIDYVEYRFILKENKLKAAQGIKSIYIYQNAIHNASQLYELTDSIHYATEAFSLCERSKSYYLYAAMQNAKALKYGGVPDSILNLEQSLNKLIVQKNNELRQLQANAQFTNERLIEVVKDSLLLLQIQQDTLLDLLNDGYPNYYQIKHNRKLYTVEEVQQSLINDKQTFLSYFQDNDHLYVFIINKDDFQFHRIKKDFPFHDWVKTFYESNTSKKFSNSIADNTEKGYLIYSKIIQPFEASLKEEVVIAPHGILNYIPFEALLVEPIQSKPQRFKNHHYFIQDKIISYCYSATFLGEMKERAPRKTSSGFLGFAPFYPENASMLDSLYRIDLDTYRAGLEPLPNSGSEVYGIQKIVGGKVIYKEAATEANFVKQAKDYSIIHLATHGKANDEQGDQSFLAFTAVKDSIENELLYVGELYNLQLNADMVVLSACETGIGELRQGEGVIGLTRGFTYAGTKSLITSLWSVNDASTKDIMLSFYKYLKEGKSKSAALRQAKLDFMQNPKLKHRQVHPFYWSPFIGIGDMQALY